MTCLYQLFEGYVRLCKPADDVLIAVLRAINKILPLQFATDSQLSSYQGQVGHYRGVIKKHRGMAFFRKTARFLQFAGGSEERQHALQYKIERDERAARELSKRQRNKIPVTEASVVKAARKWGKMETPVHSFLLAQLMTGSRKSEIMLPTVANYKREPSEIQGYIVQFGTAKEKSQLPDFVLSDEEKDDDDEVDIWANRRRVEKPILQIIKDPENSLDLFEVEDVLRAIDHVRDEMEIQRLLDQGKPNIFGKWDRAFRKAISAAFHDANEFAKIHRTNQLSTHFLRKLYANYGYQSMGNPRKETFAGWASQYLGWKASSGLTTSVSYSDVQIVMLPLKVPEMPEATLKIQALVAECKNELIGDEGSDLEGADVVARVRHRRKLKRSFIDISTDDATVRIAFHKRRRDGSAVERAREAMRQFELVGVQPGNTLLRSMGYGGESVKAAIVAGPVAAPEDAMDVE